jgi:large subunit ribosomal protein L17
MRHGDKINNLGRKKAHRDALLSNLASQLIQHKRIVTTVAKAKALRVYVEPLITKAKENTTHQRRVVFAYLQDKEAIKELFSTVSEKVGGRPGGYTRVIKLGTRPGDNAELAMIELVDFNEIYGKGREEKREPAKRTRRAGGGKKKAEGAENQATEQAAAEENA